MVRTLTNVILFIGILSFNQIFAYERDSRHYALNELNVENNTAILRRANKCVGCYLSNARLSGMDLTNADLRGANLIGATLIRATLYGANLRGAKLAGANFSGALWVDGSICRVGSVGRCIRKRPAQPTD